MTEAALKDLLTTLVTGKQEQDERFKELLAALKDPEPDPVAVRRDQVIKITSNFNKGKKFKQYKVTHDIKLFLKMFDEEIVNMRAAVGLADELQKAEWVPIFRGSLDLPVVERVKVLLAGKNKS